MATEVKLPRLGQGMESGTIVRWLRKEGDAVKKNDPLFELDTDKVTQEIEAETDGVLLEILVREGDVEVGTTVAVIGTPGEDPTAPASSAPETVAEEPAEEPAAEPPSSNGAVTETELPPVAAIAAPPPKPSATPSTRVKASPLARRVAREKNVDLAQLAGTGPDGRITAQDVERAAAGTPAAIPSAPAVRSTAVAPAEVEVIQLTSTRKTIATRLSDAWKAPVFQLAVRAEMTEALALREALVARTQDGQPKPTVNDLLVKLSAAALMRHPALNAQFTGDEIHRYPSAMVGIAVAAPNGLVVPVIRSAERLSVNEVATARADLVGRAREGKLTLDDLQGGTFTISNLGMFGVEQFTAVINPPQVAILAVGAVKEEPVVVDGAIDIAPLMHLTLTCDHRAIDGADGAEFLRTLVTLIEQPALAL